MYNVSKRFRKYAARITARYSGRNYDSVTEYGHWQSYHAGRRGRRWITGYCLKHAFEAVTYPRHAQQPGVELERTYIRKLSLRRMADQRIVALFDRGWKVFPRGQRAVAAVRYFVSNVAIVEYGPSVIGDIETAPHSGDLLDQGRAGGGSPRCVLPVRHFAASRHPAPPSPAGPRQQTSTPQNRK